ncbi:MAG: hypothetical protein GJU73_05300 [Ferrovum sp.]|jgi:hypothetical protein|uniref:hypothetical protein n=1 Tax=Ferrovum sp. TaxID=2609467 RepID=UPI00262C1EA6|nr:hypothetical protein [Ferrovum sp.]MBW8066845.1 hypothetical protein [Ferrovum sp.]
MITIANTSRQHHKFVYRKPGKMQADFIDIAPGRQDMIGRDFTAGESESVILQLLRMGARPKEEFDKKPDPDFHGLVFSLHKPLTTEQIQESAAIVIDGADIVAAQESIKSALGSDAAIYNADGKPRKGRESTVTVVATDPNGSPLKNGIDMNLTISPNGDKLKMPGK